MLRRSLLASPVLLGAPALAHPPQEPRGAEAERMIFETKALRERLAKAVTARDATLLRAHYHPAFTHTHESGKVDDRDARIASALAGEEMIETAPADDLVFRVHTGPTVIATGRTPSLGLRWVAVYVTAREGWQLAVSQATRLAP